jgi:class 3 adenylate cyclase
MKKAGQRLQRKVRFSLRWKITLPFIFLALTLGLGAAFLVNQLLQQTEEFQYLRQLADSGQQAADAVVRIENDLLEVERLIANTEGVPQAVALQNAEDLRARVLPFVINAGVDVAIVLDSQATSLLAIRHRPGGPASDYEVVRGETIYNEWDFVNRILSGESDEIGDKQVGLESIQVGEVEQNAFLIGGPLRDNQGSVIGVAIVGDYLGNVIDRISDEAGANIGIYDMASGILLNSSLEPDSNDVLTLSPSELGIAFSESGDQNLVRNISVSGSTYNEVLVRLKARQGTSDLGVLGISLLETKVEGVLLENVFTVARYGAVALVLVVTIGLLISNTITRPLVEIAEASAQVAAGNLDSYVPTRTSDEIGVLASSFNTLVKGLREGPTSYNLTRESILSEIEDPHILKTRQTQSLDGETVEASILAVDLSAFISGTEHTNPKTILATLNECYSKMLPVIHNHGGEVSRFDGDTLVAFFGVLPQRLQAEESALFAVHAGLELLEFVERWNSRRSTKGLPALEVWMGITTGPVIAGGIGNLSQLRYNVIGDTVKEARGVQEICRELGGGALLISETTYNFLSNAHRQFKFGRYGNARLRHSGLSIRVYEVNGRRTRLKDEGPWKGREWKRGKDARGS